MDDCEFCDIIAGRKPATFAGQWQHAVAFFPLNPVTPGHILVVPRTHVADALEYPSITAKVMATVASIARRPCNIITSVGKEATQSIFHLHVHIVPRREDDGLCLPWSNHE